MRKITIENVKIIRNVRSLIGFIRTFKIDPHYLLLATSLSLAAALFEGVSAGLLIPLVRGIIGMNFDFLKGSHAMISVMDRLPMVFRSQTSILTALILIIFVSAITKNLLQYISSLIVSYQIRKLSHNLRVTIFTRYLSFGKLFFDINSPGHLANVLMGFTWRISQQLTTQQEILNSSLTVIIYLLIMFFISWKLTLTTLLLFPILHYLLNLIIKRIKANSLFSIEYEKRLGREVSNALSCIPLVKLCAQESCEIKKFSDLSATVEKIEFSMDKKRVLTAPLQEIFTISAVLVLVFIMTLIATTQRTADVTTFLVYFYLIKRCSTAFGILSTSRSYLAVARGPIKEVENILNNKDKHFVPDGSKLFEGLKDRIDITNLFFSYKKGVDVLKGITFAVEKGKMVAIVGPTGAGKTTIINLLARFYDCPPSSIFIDGVDLRDFRLDTLRSHMAIVSQDDLLFDDTIRNNIAYGSSRPVSDDKISDILRKARLADFIKHLPNGVDTYIGDRGVQLSGGEKQRIAIARALLREPDILILDEATSSLDSHTEELIQEAIEEMVKGKTTIVIAHRLSTIKNAHKIVVIEDGGVLEEGTLQEILEKRGAFYRYWESQKFY